jgi:hypothetical protein
MSDMASKFILHGVEGVEFENEMYHRMNHDRIANSIRTEPLKPEEIG